MFLIPWSINFWLVLSFYTILWYMQSSNLLLWAKNLQDHFFLKKVQENVLPDIFVYLIFQLGILCMLILLWISNYYILARSTWKHGPLCAVWKQCWKTWICSWDLCKSLFALLWSVPDWKFLFWLELSRTMVFIPYPCCHSAEV